MKIIPDIIDFIMILFGLLLVSTFFTAILYCCYHIWSLMLS